MPKTACNQMMTPSTRRLSALLGAPDGRSALCAGAHVYVNFLSLTRRSGWLQGHISKQGHGGPLHAIKATHAREALVSAASRHLAFMDLRKANPNAVPTRDISVVWSADLLRPQVGAILEHAELEDGPTAWFNHQQHRLLQSGARFEKGRQWNISEALKRAAFMGAFGAAVTRHPVGAGIGALVGAASSSTTEVGAKTTPALRRFDSDDSGIVSVVERRTALDAWQREYDATAAEWQKRYSDEYRLVPGQMPHTPPVWRAGIAERVLGALGGTAAPSCDVRAEQLADAVASQASFVGRILALGPKIVNDAWIERAVDRYCQFLQLAQEHPNELLVPTLDVDLIWHVHMLSPLDYRDDCQAMLGRILSHDDQMAEGRLASAFQATKDKWHAAHGTPYIWREPASGSSGGSSGFSSGGYSGCGSCGWGEADFHSELQHRTHEPQQITEVYGGATLVDVDPISSSNAMGTAGDGMAEQEPWAVDASAPSATSVDGELLSDPWAAPESSTDGAGDGSWGWGGDGGDSGGEGGDCGGGCGGD